MLKVNILAISFNQVDKKQIYIIFSICNLLLKIKKITCLYFDKKTRN